MPIEGPVNTDTGGLIRSIPPWLRGVCLHWLDQRDVTGRLARLGVTHDEDVDPILDLVDPDAVRTVSDELFAYYLGIAYVPYKPHQYLPALAPSPGLAPSPQLAPSDGT